MNEFEAVSQYRNIKQILGHKIDSASNNTHRIVYLQYRESPCDYPNYATKGNNDKWIAIQDYLRHLKLHLDEIDELIIQ